MDHDQQLVQLRDFDQQVLLQPDDAQSFATKGFLETLSALIQYGCEKQDDGTDAYKEELKALKSATRAFSTVLPIVYRTV
jgi:symplekin